jgi:hypothetical protein
MGYFFTDDFAVFREKCESEKILPIVRILLQNDIKSQKKITIFKIHNFSLSCLIQPNSLNISLFSFSLATEKKNFPITPPKTYNIVKPGLRSRSRSWSRNIEVSAPAPGSGFGSAKVL